MATRCCMPPDNSFGYFISKPVSPTISISPWARSRPALRSRPRTCTGSSTFPSTVRHGSNVGLWKTMPTSRLGPSIGESLSQASPAVRGVRPPSTLSKVLLPQPLGPTTVRNSPAATDRSIEASASTLCPSRVSYLLATRLHTIDSAPARHACGGVSSRTSRERTETICTSVSVRRTRSCAISQAPWR